MMAGNSESDVGVFGILSKDRPVGCVRAAAKTRSNPLLKAICVFAEIVQIPAQFRGKFQGFVSWPGPPCQFSGDSAYIFKMCGKLLPMRLRILRWQPSRIRVSPISHRTRNQCSSFRILVSLVSELTASLRPAIDDVTWQILSIPRKLSEVAQGGGGPVEGSGRGGSESDCHRSVRGSAEVCAPPIKSAAPQSLANAAVRGSRMRVRTRYWL